MSPTLTSDDAATLTLNDRQHLAAAFIFVFLLPKHAREEERH